MRKTRPVLPLLRSRRSTSYSISTLYERVREGDFSKQNFVFVNRKWPLPEVLAGSALGRNLRRGDRIPRWSMQRPREFLEKDLLTAYDNACQDSYFHIPVGVGLKVYGYLLALSPSLRARLPCPPYSYTLRRVGKLRRKEACRRPDFMYENSI